jgi:uncharacterized protein YegP (UPF0339 family)
MRKMETYNVGEYYRDAAGEWRFRIRDFKNRQIIADGGEGYKSVEDAQKAMRRLGVSDDHMVLAEE